MYSKTVLEHFSHPRNAGELAAPAITVQVENPACGDVMRLSAIVENGIVKEVRYQVRGCTASIAAGSVTTELMEGVSPQQLVRIDARAIEAAIGGLEPESKHAAILCADSVKALLAKLV